MSADHRVQTAPPPTLFIVCGLPGSGKTTHATHIERQSDAFRFCPDEWMTTLGINLWDSEARGRVESLQWELTKNLLRVGHSVVIEWGTWTRSERDRLRTVARALGARVELHFLDEPSHVLIERVRSRRRESPPIELEQIERWSAQFERPSLEERALFDPVCLEQGDV